MLKFSGDRLREWRKEKGITQSDLADAVGTYPHMISRYELDTVTPKIDRVLALCAVLGCTVEDLCEVTE